MTDTEKIATEMIDLLCQKAIGVIFACNIVDSVAEDVIEKRVAQEFIKLSTEVFNDERKDISATEALIGMMVKIARGQHPKQTDDFQLQKKYPVTVPERWTNVVENDDFVAHIVNKPADYGLSIAPDPGDPTHSLRYQHLNSLLDFPYIKPDSKLGGGTGVFWVTNHQFPLTDSPDQIRDKLGLVHYGENHCLIAIDIESQNLNVDIARPSFADAATHRRFRARLAYPGLLGGDVSWGKTVDLERFAKGDVAPAGEAERVVRRTEFGAELAPSVRFIGWPALERGNSPADDDAIFPALLLAGRSVASIQNDLLALVSP